MFGIAPRLRDAKLTKIITDIVALFGIAPRLRDAKLPDPVEHIG